MLLSLSIIIFFGIVFHQVFTRIKLPGFLGILFLGMLLGPYGLDYIDSTLLSISPDLRLIALLVILLRAGLGIHRKSLQLVGAPTLRLGFIPVLFEGFTLMFIAVFFLRISYLEAGMLGFIIAAVSPAVIVPQMLHFIEQGKGKVKGIPTMILAGSSLDDVVAIIIFSAFAGVFAGSHVHVAIEFLLIPVAIITGIAIGIALALFLLFLFKRFSIRHTKKVLLILATAILLTAVEDALQHIVPISALLGVMVLGFVLYDRNPELGKQLSLKYNKIWVFAEILLFFLVGAEVNITMIGDASLVALGLIFAGLSARALGVYLSLLQTNFSFLEKSFCMLAYIPKATVQAAIGSIPFALGAPAGEFILLIAVLSIIITAPLGAFATKLTGERWL